MKKQITKNYIFLLLIMMFAAPGIAAYLFYQNPSWLGVSKVNKGTLLNPPVVLHALDGAPKWRIIFWSPGDCDKVCLKQLNTLARIRLALGRKLYQVDQWVLLGDKATPLSQETQSLLKEIDFKMAQLPAAELNDTKALSSEAKVFLADPNNYLILSYSPQANPNDVYRDLKLLLNTTEAKNG